MVETKENKMGTMSEGKLLLSMSLPIMISMIIQALYNIVDSIFVAKFSQDALTGVTVAFPMQNLMIAVGSGTGVGISAFLSKSLGEGKRELASKVAKNGLLLAGLSWTLFLVIGIFFARPFIASQTSSEAVVEYGAEYLSLCSVLSFGIFFQITLERLLQSTGKTFFTMITQATGAIINIILDPIFIFGYFGLPAMGISGAAIATVFGQTIAAVLGIIFNLKLNKELDFSFKGFKPDIDIIKRIYVVGLPSIVMMAISSVMTFAMNKILDGFSTVATNVFGIYFKLQSFAVMPVVGINNGMVPIISYNYGARRKDRIMKTIKYSVIFALSITIGCMLIFQFFPEQLIKMFAAEGEAEALLEMGVPALRIISLNFIFAGFCIVSGSVFQAMGNGVLSLIVSVARQLVVLVPAAYILSKIGGVNAVWWSFPLAECMSVLCSAVFLVLIYKKTIKKLDEPEKSL
ncbi:MAG: MATE family efflux transporter [Ruminiclostridium sp.]|nr:MATE family efflux transporter [Ruminiclostridium sp.]